MGSKRFECFIVLLLISGVLAVVIIIIQFIIGIIFNGKCPVQPLVAIYNLVAGSTGIVLIILCCIGLFIVRCEKSVPTAIKIVLVIVLVLLALFQVAWGIVGGYYILPLRKNNNITQFENPQLPTYCQPILYWMSFVILIMYFSALSLAGVDAVSMLPGSS